MRDSEKTFENRSRFGVFVLLGVLAAGAFYYITRPLPPGNPATFKLPEKLSEKVDSRPKNEQSRSSNQQPSDQSADGRNSETVQAGGIIESMPDGTVFLPEVIELARTLDDPDRSVSEQIGMLQNLLEIYRKSLGGNPIGLNREIVRQLSGENRLGYSVLPPDLKGINGDGELVDQWRTPYFFHAVSREIMEIQSAGPDGRHWTEDDIHSELDLRQVSR